MGVRSTPGSEVTTHWWWENLKENDRLQDLDIDVIITSRWILKIQGVDVGMCGLDSFIYLEPVAGCCGQGSELTCYINPLAPELFFFNFSTHCI